MAKSKMNPIGVVLGVVLAISIMSPVALAVVPDLVTQPSRTTAKENATIGTVVDKTFEGDGGMFTSIVGENKEYRIYISVPYEFNGETLTTDKWFTVTETVWNQYQIGDTFDSTIAPYMKNETGN